MLSPSLVPYSSYLIELEAKLTIYIKKLFFLSYDWNMFGAILGLMIDCKVKEV